MKISRHYIPTFALEQIYKSFIRPVIEYGDVIYSVCAFDKYNEKHSPLSLSISSLMSKLESIQYQAARYITGTWKGSSMEKVYNLIGWEYLSHRRWVNRMCLFYKVLHGLTPTYLKSIITFSDSLRSVNKFVTPLETRTYRYKMSFFPTTIFSWNKILSAVDRGSASLTSFLLKLKSRIMKSKTNNFGLHFFA